MAELPALPQAAPCIPRKPSSSFILDIFQRVTTISREQWGSWWLFLWGDWRIRLVDHLGEGGQGFPIPGQEVGGRRVAASGSRMAPSGAVLCCDA